MRSTLLVCLGLAVTGLVSCAAPPTEADYPVLLRDMLARSFRSQGIAQTSRLLQDPANASCSQAQGEPLAPEVFAALQASARQSVRWPQNDQFLGDWREGEKLAQNGRGMTWTDKTSLPQDNGGNCLNCHQVTLEEVSYGTLGPSLYRYAQNHGVQDPLSAQAQAMVRYTWAKLYNAKSTNPCSDMPRFGHAGLLDETQLKHLMALLLDPQSPVNR